jgi:hypothetical protein
LRLLPDYAYSQEDGLQKLNSLIKFLNWCRCGQATSEFFEDRYYMNAFTQIRWSKLGVVLSFVLAMSSIGLAEDEKKNDKKVDRRLSRISRTPVAVEGFQSVEMFSAMEKGEIKVRIVPKNANSSNLFVENTTDRPLSIQMPATFSAVPAMRLQQMGGGVGGVGGMGGMGGMPGGGMGMGGMGGGGMGGQGFGGGMGGMGGMGGGGMGGMGMGGMGGGMFNIPPGKKGKLQLNTVCLEEGRPDPKSTMEYVIQPLEKLNNDPRIAEVCMMLGNNEISTQVAQAAAWHLTDNLSWEQLLVKNRSESMNGTFERFFHPLQIQYAQRALVVAAERVQLRAELEKKQEGGSDGFYNQATPTVSSVNR